MELKSDFAGGSSGSGRFPWTRSILSALLSCPDMFDTFERSADEIERFKSEVLLGDEDF